MAAAPDLPRLSLPRDLCRDPHLAVRREWLVTNGIGGFAAGTVAGALTRRYHGLLLAALRPPLGRTLLVAKLDETVTIAGGVYPLSTNIWTTGIESPAGCEWLDEFAVIGGVPTWRYIVADTPLSKRIWMEHGRNATFVQYSLPTDARPLELAARLLVNCRDYHTLTRGEQRPMRGEARGAELTIHPGDHAGAIRARCAGPAPDGAHWRLDHTWYRRFYLPVEADRGYDHIEDHLSAGVCHVTLQPGTTATFVLATEADADVAIDGAFDRCLGRAAGAVTAWRRTAPPGDGADAAPPALAHLAIAADQFLVRRRTASAAGTFAIVAGYPWFSDWSRDTMVALPGLTLATGNPDIARQILLAWAGFVHGGLIPNRLPDTDDTPEYHTADATLWYLWAIDQYCRATDDVDTLATLFPVATDVIEWHQRGTRHRIHMADDGLIHAGHAGINVTWMDAKIGDRVITPRTGKPIEINALWYNALRNLARWAARLGRPGSAFTQLADRVQAAFARFWNADRRACHDVIDGPLGADDRIQANQIHAVALDHSPLTPAQQRAVVDTCAAKLLTPYGLRTLAPDERGYHGRYVGNHIARDEAYHTGTAWGWLLGPFVIADYRVRGDRARARALLAPMLGQLSEHALGTLSEVFDGDPPHTPGGAFAQAWSVAETLRAWHVTQGAAGD